MPKHSDFQEIYDAMQEQYGDRVDEVYGAWLNKHSYDDTAALASQKSGIRHLEFDKLFLELFRRLRAAALGFYENWLRDQGLDETLAISLQKSEFLKGGGQLSFVKEDALHLRIDGMLTGSFEKIDGATELIVAGYASTCVEDTWGDKFTPDMIREGAERYLETPIVFYCHRRSEPAGLILAEYRSPSGKLYKTGIDEVGWYVISKPSDALRNVSGLIREGLLKAYSIGGYYIFDRLGELIGTTIHDLSYVPRPANRLSYHGIVSKIGIQRSDNDMEKEAVQALINESMKVFTDNLTSLKEEIETKLEELKTSIEGVQGLDEIKTQLEELKTSVEGVEGLEDFNAFKEEIEGKIEDVSDTKTELSAAVERIATIEELKLDEFKKNADDLDVRVKAIEDTPYVKGIAGGTPPPDDTHEKIWKADDPLAEVERMRRGL